MLTVSIRRSWLCSLRQGLIPFVFLILTGNQSCWHKSVKKQSVFVPLLQIDGPLDVVVLFPGKAPPHNVPRILNNHKGVRIKLRD